MRSEAVWITGIGVGTAHGWDFPSVTNNLIAGQSHIRKIDRFDVSQHASQIGCVLDDMRCPPEFDSVEFGTRSRLEQLSLWCCSQALRDAGMWQGRDRLRIGLVLATAIEWGWHWEDAYLRTNHEPPCDPACDPPLVARMVTEKIGIHGPVSTISAACASGNFALAQARRWLQLGIVDVCLAGGCDAAVTPITLAGFSNLRALSRRNDDPLGASRPFDKGRDGFVMGEGGAVFLLEPATAARRRGAHVYGELAGCGLSSDAYHPVIPSPEPTQSIIAIRGALTDAQLDPSDVDYVNAHGTSTPVGDIAEAKAIREVFGDRVMRVPVSSTKSMTGHLLTAASALEALVCLGTFAAGAIPPTINLDDPDPECQLRHVAHQAIEQPVRVAISNSFGFGGSNSCAVFKAV